MPEPRDWTWWFPGRPVRSVRWSLPQPMAEYAEKGPFVTYFQVETTDLETAAGLMQALRELCEHYA